MFITTDMHVNIHEDTWQGLGFAFTDCYLLPVKYKSKNIFVFSVQFSCSVLSNSLWSHALQHASLPCPSPTPGANSNSFLSKWWCHPTISSSVVPVSSCLQSFPASGSFSRSQSAFPIRWPKYWSFSFSVSPSNEYSGRISFRIDCFDLLVQGTFKSFLQHHSSKASFLQRSAFFMVQLSHPYVTPGKHIAGY